MRNSTAKYEELNAIVTNTKDQLKAGSISIDEAKKLLNIIYKELQNLEEEEKSEKIGEVTDILISRWLSIL